MVVTNEMLNSEREQDCFAVTMERKYYRIEQGKIFVKRSLRPCEWQTTKGTIYVLRQGRERLRNEAACLRFIKETTNIPVPKLYCQFEDADAVYLIMEYIEGVDMDELGEDEKKVVAEELELHLQTLHTLRSSKVGGPGGQLAIPYRATLGTSEDEWDTYPCFGRRRICFLP